MRGKESGKLSKGTIGGITPAYAGKRGSMQPALRQKRDHPRLCGEKG